MKVTANDLTKYQGLAQFDNIDVGMDGYDNDDWFWIIFAWIVVDVDEMGDDDNDDDGDDACWMIVMTMMRMLLMMTLLMMMFFLNFTSSKKNYNLGAKFKKSALMPSLEYY